MINKVIIAVSAAVCVTVSCSSVFAQGLTFGSYVKFELGGAFDASGDAYWEPPGFPSDPRVFFDLSKNDGLYASAAVGHEWSDGLRGDISLSHFGDRDFSGPWSHTSPTTAGPHADITGGSVSSTALMLNGYWSPFGASGGSGSVQPFVTAGLGLSRNKMGDWTRTNASASQVDRTFEGASKTDFAWAIGVGVSGQVGAMNGNPVLLEATYRYFDLGQAVGSGTPLPGSGTSQ